MFLQGGDTCGIKGAVMKTPLKGGYIGDSIGDLYTEEVL